MTVSERDAIDKLRDEVHAYHVEIREMVAKCNACQDGIRKLTTDMYGVPGLCDESPGLMGDVADLKRSRRLILYAVRGAWALLTILFGAVVAKVWP